MPTMRSFLFPLPPALRSSTSPLSKPSLAISAKPSATPPPLPWAVSFSSTPPATIILMGWGGAGSDAGNVSAGTGTYFFLGAILLYAGGIGEWILGNTFPSVFFFTFVGFWGAFGATLTPLFNAIAAYKNPDGFYNSFAMFLIFMTVLCGLYAIAALRTNVCLVDILVCFTVTLPCFAASYFDAVCGELGMSKELRIIGAAFASTASLIAWYLWVSMILDSVDFPLVLPVGDLSSLIKGRSKKDVESRWSASLRT